jgi:hypothetical protein
MRQAEERSTAQGQPALRLLAGGVGAGRGRAACMGGGVGEGLPWTGWA